MSADFRVGSWLVEPSLNIISRNGTTAHVEPKVMEVLVCLAGHAGETLQKETLLQGVWPDTFVSDDALKHCISELRRVLEDDARDPRIIQTIPKRGYRLLAPVESVNGTKDFSTRALQGPVSSDTAGARAHRWWMVAVTIGAIILPSVLLIALNWSFLRGRLTGTSNPSIHSLAVLPLQNLSADPSQEYFSDGMTDALITDLAQIGSVKVISRTSSTQYKQTKKSLPDIARELNVDAIVEGTVQYSGDRVRITAQLVHGPSDKHLWANSYERELRDVFALEKDVAGDIADHVQAKLKIQNQSAGKQPGPMDPKILESYLQGNYHLNKVGRGGGDEERRKAAEYFQQAIDADPNFAPAYIGLAYSHENLLWPSSNDLAIMRRAAEKAVALDPSSSDAHIALALAKCEVQDWTGSAEEARRAVALNPNNVQAHDLLGGHLEEVEPEESWKHFQIAQELDPNHDHLAGALYDLGQYDRAIEQLLRMADAYPEDGFIHYELAENYAQKGMYKEWARETGKVWTLYGFPEVSDRLQRAFATSGYRGALRQGAKEMEQLAATKRLYFPGVLAKVYATLGDKDRSFYWLEQGYEHRREGSADPLLWAVKTDPGFAPLRSDPRYKDLVRRINLPP